MAVKRFCDYCGKEAADPAMGWWTDVFVGKPLKLAVSVYDQEIGDTDLCNTCYHDALVMALGKLKIAAGIK